MLGAAAIKTGVTLTPVPSASPLQQREQTHSDGLMKPVIAGL